jgi:MscS family membrane protein
VTKQPAYLHHVAAVALLLVAGPALAQSPAPSPKPDAESGRARGEIADDSPRAALSAFLELSRAGRYDEAGRFLDVPDDAAPRAAELAKRLKAVLDRQAWIDLDAVSSLSEGDVSDGLPAALDEIAAVSFRSGRREPVRLVKGPEDDGAHWRFARSTVTRIDAWYAQLPDHWFREHLPDVLLRPGPRELLWWQWLALPLLLVLALALARPLAFLTQSLLGRVFARTRTEWDDALLERLRGPLRLGWGLAVAAACIPALELYVPARLFVGQTLRAAATVVFFWALLRAVDIGGEAMRTSVWGQASPSARSIVFLGARFAKVSVLALGLLTALTQLGYPVAGLLAGLGIGGLALALAAQKTVENLFGSVSLAIDRPFAVGDFVKVDDFVGTVEAIGLRSTQFRTLDRTLISIPNGRVADMRLESFSARDRMRLACTIGVEYGTSSAQMQEVLKGLEDVLRAHPRIWPDAVVVRFKEFAASSLDIEVMAWFETAVWSEFQLIRQEILLDFMRVVEGAGASFAFPTRTVHVVNDTRAASGSDAAKRP